jgi:integrase
LIVVLIADNFIDELRIVCDRVQGNRALSRASQDRTSVTYHSPQRPGELARLKLTDILPEERCLVIRKAKADNDIRVPLSRPIEQVLKLARDAHNGKSEWLFPARAGGFIKRFDSDGLPCWGSGLRHNFKNIAVTMKPPVEEILTEFLLGHAPKGVSRKYVSAMIVAQSDALHEAQARISERLVTLLGIRL